MHHGAAFSLFVLIGLSLLATRAEAVESLTISATTQPAATTAGAFEMGTSRSPDGHEIGLDSRSLLRDGKPWLPAMGEFHFTRFPEAGWRDELLKMKAGGIDVVSTYVFWIHHEEVEGKWDWSGRRSLRDFVALCGQLGMPVIVRVGPWCHGEVRNGGFPDWLMKKGYKLRSDDPGYLGEVKTLYGQIAAQLNGLLWKDGGPVIGIQLENEYGGRAEHLLTLKRLAREAGIDVPLYTRTGWPSLHGTLPFGELLPVYGGYPDGFWDRSRGDMPGSYWTDFAFALVRTDTAIANEQLGRRDATDAADVQRYPYFSCELGGGMMPSYHRRIFIAPADVAAPAMVKVGSGDNLPGYYMYHGGTNPDGQLTTLEENQSIGGYNDLPVENYDFQAPLGQFGQVREHYHLLRNLHLFLRDYGARLAEMPPTLPAQRPKDGRDVQTLRWSVRSDGRSGFVFVNNYQRLAAMPEKRDAQFDLKLADGALRIPSQPCTVAADSFFFWPFNLDLGGAKLVYATAQPVCNVDDGGTRYTVFAQTAGVPSEFVIDAAGGAVEAIGPNVETVGGQIRIADVKPGTEPVVRLKTADGRQVAIILLDEATSLGCWKASLGGRDRIFLTHANLTTDADGLTLGSSDASEMTVAVLPAPAAAMTVGDTAVAGEADGAFRRFTVAAAPTQPMVATLEPVRAAGPAPEVRIGKAKVATPPPDAAFDEAAVWRVKLPEGLDPRRDLLLRIRYAGDVARLYLDGKLVNDDFYHGAPFDLGLKHLGAQAYRGELLLKVLPLRKDAPIYLPQAATPEFGPDGTVARVAGVEIVEERAVRLGAR